MTPGEALLVADTRDAVGESPSWCAAEHALVWTDILGRRVHRLDVQRGTVRDWASPVAIGALAPAQGGGFVAATDQGFARVTLGEGDALMLDPIAPVLAGQDALRFNDGRCDRQGRFWASSMAWTPDPLRADGTLWRLERGEASPITSDLVLGNGLAWSPDGRTMYLADTARTRALVWAFDFDCDEGLPMNRRLFLDLRDSGGRPDGAAVDTDGCYWLAATDAGEVRRYTPEGRLDLRIAVPVAHPTMPAFGGADLRTLFVTSIRTAGAAENDPDGGVFAIAVQQQGMIERAYVG